MVRSCTVGYLQARAPTKKEGCRSIWQVLQRSIQHLTLLLPIEDQNEQIEVTDGVVTRALPTDSDSVQFEDDDCELPDETERDTNLERLDNGEDVSFGSENRIESILSPAADVFVPRKASKTKIAFGTEEVNSLDKSGESYCDDYSNCDASGLCNTASGQTEMGARKKTSLTDQEINNGRSEVEQRNSSSAIDV